ncbi:AAA family ATPase [Soonwooa sp.]|uniref:AAA family ATPase n=1 Tax=Soonwooa sp. TaxID=1938592 RepID=UPI0028AC8326|nr:AAA family ATPase [Soonwooa sp.]
MKAFVFGKFYPFHLGHKALIDFALQNNDFVEVMVCTEQKERLSGELRKSWIVESFSNNNRLKVIVFNYKEEDYANTSEASWEVSKQWSEIFKTYFPDFETVVTSEPYGEMIAELMSIQHQLFDINRLKHHISASEIRANIYKNWDFLPKAVQKHFSLKIVLLGTESTGKTTLTEKLAKHYYCNFVLEAGRNIVDDSKDFEFNDLKKIYLKHYKRIKSSSLNNYLNIIDTDFHITESYSEFIFNKELDIPKYIKAEQKAQLFIYLSADAPYFQDGTRLNESDRNALDIHHRKHLQKSNIDFIEISGNWQERFEKSVQLIDQLILENSKI